MTRRVSHTQARPVDVDVLLSDEDEKRGARHFLLAKDHSSSFRESESTHRALIVKTYALKGEGATYRDLHGGAAALRVVDLHGRTDLHSEASTFKWLRQHPRNSAELQTLGKH